MTTGIEKIQRLESLLASLLHYGTWIASGVIAAGILSSSMPIVTVGIGLFILLPFLRVVLMLIVFLGERDYRFVAIAAAVLLIILAGLALGICAPKISSP